MDFLRYIIVGDVYPILDSIFTHLTASDVGSVLDATDTRGRFYHGGRYLNPLRDIEPSMKYLGNMLKDHTILILGEYCIELSQRIMDSERYWGPDGKKLGLVSDVWVVAIPKECDRPIAEAAEYLRMCCTDHERGAWGSPAAEFTDIAVRKIFKQISVDAEWIGYVGDEPDWNWTWHCTSHESVDIYTHDGATTGTIVMLPKAPSESYDYDYVDMVYSGLEFHIGIENIYWHKLKAEQWGDFPYINASVDPLTVRRSTNACCSDTSNGTHIALRTRGKDDTYVSLH